MNRISLPEAEVGKIRVRELDKPKTKKSLLQSPNSEKGFEENANTLPFDLHFVWKTGELIWYLEFNTKITIKVQTLLQNSKRDYLKNWKLGDEWDGELKMGGVEGRNMVAIDAAALVSNSLCYSPTFNGGR